MWLVFIGVIIAIILLFIAYELVHAHHVPDDYNDDDNEENSIDD